ncbi:hypothetical protein [Paenibacillus phoenicis]|uniref:hypothetical protein n=1 Tax=Paenibacillus phoenicis TaxID=554117 RepID=UPI003D294591
MFKKRYIYPIFIIFFISIFFLYDNNNAYVQFQLKTDQQGSGQIFFKKANENFQESKSVKFKIKSINQWNNYKIRIPIEYFDGDIRIDPIQTEAYVFLDNIKVVKRTFFKKTEIQLNSVDSLTLTNQLEELNHNSNSFSAKSVGEDPYFQFSTIGGIRSQSLYLYIKEISILLGIILSILVLYSFFRSLSSDDIPKVIIYSFVFLLILGKILFYSYSVPYGDTPDEQMHLSYVAHLKQYDTFIPNYDRFYAFDNEGNETEAVIHLEHPSIYYHLLSIFMEDNPSDVMKSYDTARNINIIISSIAIMLLLYLGFIHKFSLSAHLLYSVAVTSIPMLGFVGAGINNDNLGLVGGALTIIGCKKIIDNYPQTSYPPFLIVSVGFAISVLTKLNVGAASGLIILLTFIYLAFKSKSIKLLWDRRFLVSCPIYLLPILYYMALYTGYGLLQPSLKNIAYDYLINSGFYVPEINRIHINLYGYVKHFVVGLWKTWSQIISHVIIPKENIYQSLSLLILPLLALLSFCIKPRDKTFSIARISFISIFFLMILHFISVYNSYLSRGYLGGIQARYYFSIVASIFLLSSELIDRIKNEKFKFIIVLSLIISLLYSDFYFYLLNNPYN